ncbi:ATP-binding protein [Aliamphritea ceti]|uniref:ATP-binding protein n=1 Tax=Aliamphritea ceti TaxID=1524258 RepID=UPI0021C36132|nr:ATP-binding protein [Aliamphritea ceti]
MIEYLRKSLPGRVIGLLILGFGLLNALTVYVFYEERGRAVRLNQMEDLVTRSASMGRLLDETPVYLHHQILTAISTDKFLFSIDAEPSVKPEDAASLEHPLYQQLLNSSPANNTDNSLSISPRYYWCYSWIKNLLSLDLTFGTYDGRRPIAIVSIQRETGNWLNAVLMPSSFFPGWIAAVLVALALFTLSVVMVVLIVRRVTRPLAVLTSATDKIGRGELDAPIPVQGPEDVRRTTKAFNRMRDRIERFVQNRTQMLAAISHDLRTPLTSLRLQAEFVTDSDTREKIINTLNEMQEMTEATLAFTQEDAAREESRTIDLSALVGSLCEDLQDIGLEIENEPAERLPYACRPAGLKRALNNLIENACYYGGSANVSLWLQAEEVVISIRDKGTGIPEEDWERVFDPFVRLESSRCRNTGGIGLGMAIARSIAHAHGGEIYLQNLQPDGFEVQMRLPT